MNLRDLRGLGPKSEVMLATVSITTVDEFMAVDPCRLFAKLRQEIPGLSLNMIYAIIGAREDRHWQEIARTRKTEILLQLENLGIKL